MKTSKILAMLLCLGMLVGLMAGCGGKTASSSEAPAADASASVAETPETPEEPASVPAAEDASVEEPSAQEEAAAPTDPMEEMKTEYISYPLEGDNTITMWYYAPPYVNFVDSNTKFNCIDDAEAATGVKLDFIEVGSSSASEQFNLMVSAGDMTDLIPCREYYSGGGLSKAYEEEIIIDIWPYVEENMPNYLGVYNTLDERTQRETKTDGLMLAFSNISDGTLTQNGLVTRADWLQKMNYEIPEGDTMSLEDFTDLLRRFHSEFNTPYTYYMTDGTMPVGPAFDISVPLLRPDGFMSFTTSAIYRKGDTVTTGWTQDGYRDYLEWLLGLMDEGVIYKDYMSLSMDRGDTNTAQGNGSCAVWQAGADKIEEIAGYSDDPNIAFAPLPAVTDDPSQPYLWQQEESLVSTNGGMSISTNCQNPELVCQWMNYFWTYDGYLMANYGVEGEALTWEGDEPRFDWQTPLTANGVNAPNADMATELFTMQRFVTTYKDHDRLLPNYSQVALDAVELWTIEGAPDERNIPQTLTTTFTTEENETIAQYESDILTYAAETALKFLDGALELNDENWNTYVDTVNSMGMPKILEVYQNAYDEYVAGTR